MERLKIMYLSITAEIENRRNSGKIKAFYSCSLDELIDLKHRIKVML